MEYLEKAMISQTKKKINIIKIAIVAAICQSIIQKAEAETVIKIFLNLPCIIEFIFRHFAAYSSFVSFIEN